MKVYLVNRTNQHEDGGVEYKTETTVAASLNREKVEALAARGGWAVEEMELDQVFRDSWLVHLDFRGDEVQCVGPVPVIELPKTRPDPWKTGCYGYGWTEDEAREAARRCYDREVKVVYEKTVGDTEERKRLLGIK